MDSISIDSYGKINLGLKVVGKREDGYHNIKTIMQEIDLADRVYLRRRKEALIIDSNGDIPLDESNLAVQAYRALGNYAKIDEGLEIYIDKKIPVAAGLAGGSSNAAAVLKGLNQLWQLDYSLDTLREIGRDLGADVPFCLTGGTKLAQGIGDEFTDIGQLKGAWLLLINPGFKSSTVEVYKKLDLDRPLDLSGLDLAVEAVEAGSLEDLAANLVNDLESAVENRETIREIKSSLVENRALNSLMSGSGPTVFGIFSSREDRDYCYEKMREKYRDYYIIKTRTI